MFFFGTTARTKSRFELGQNTDSNVCYNLKKHKISTRKNLKIVTKQRKLGANCTRTGRARYLHHNYKKQ